MEAKIELPEQLAFKSTQELRELIGLLAYDDAYGCWTRPGLEYVVWPQIRDRARYAIFADLDRLHGFNEALGYEEVNQRIRAAIQLRKTDISATGRWFSGDEMLWLLCDASDRSPINPQLAAERLQASFRSQGLSATFAISRILTANNLAANVMPAIRKVQRAKQLDRRGTINQTGQLDWNVFGGRS